VPEEEATPDMAEANAAPGESKSASDTACH
jgi:hypothetical protein